MVSVINIAEDFAASVIIAEVRNLLTDHSFEVLFGCDVL
jgi:hypothetical protein